MNMPDVKETKVLPAKLNYVETYRLEATADLNAHLVAGWSLLSVMTSQDMHGRTDTHYLIGR
jgi:hypothetical protein